jgi:hypothetical protein
MIINPLIYWFRFKDSHLNTVDNIFAALTVDGDSTLPILYVIVHAIFISAFLIEKGLSDKHTWVLIH